MRSFSMSEGLELADSKAEKENLIQKDPETLETDSSKRLDEPVVGFIYLGFVLNMCLNFVLQEVNYFNDVFGPNFGGRASFAYSISNIIGQVIMIALPADISFTGRISISCLLMGASMLAVPLMTFWSMDFTIFMVYGLVVVLGVSNAVLASAAFGITGFCSEKIRRFFNMGVCVSGILVWPLMFVIDTMLGRMFGMSPRPKGQKLPCKMEMVSCLLVLSISGLCFFATIPYFIFGLGKTRAVTEAIEKIKEKEKAKKPRNFGQVLLATMPMAAAVWNVMLLTFIALPGLMVQWLPSYDYRFKGENTYKELVIFTFNVFDFLGRVCAVNWITLSQAGVLIASLSRWILIPFFFLAAANMTMFSNDIFKFLLQALFAGSYGVVMTWGMTHGPSQPGLHPENADLAGMIMSIVLVVGVMMGSLFSDVVSSIPSKLLRFEPYRRPCTVDPTMQMLVCPVDPLT